MGRKAQNATGCREITILADRGYYSGDQVLACEDTGVLPCIPKTLTSGNAKVSDVTRPFGLGEPRPSSTAAVRRDD